MPGHTLFISDLHLQKEEPELTATFLHFMGTQAPKADALYILGDFFEAWIGDDDHTPFNQTIIEALRKLAQTTTPIYFMRGNRDLLIGKQFANAAQITLLEDPSIIELYHKPILLTHGDILCTLDIRHQKYRKKVTNPYLQKLFLTTPLCFRRALARHMRKKSQAYSEHTSARVMDVTPQEVVRMMDKHNVELLIHGHTHRPNIHDVKISQYHAKRIVLGSWHHNGSVLIYRDDHSFELQTFPFVEINTI